MTGLGPVTHDLRSYDQNTWVAGPSPAMTKIQAATAPATHRTGCVTSPDCHAKTRYPPATPPLYWPERSATEPIDPASANRSRPSPARSHRSPETTEPVTKARR